MAKNDYTDFGEKIGGARKDLWAKRGLISDDLKYMLNEEMIRYVRKENVWKKPDYEQLIKDGIPREAVYFIKIFRDSIPTQPDVFVITNDADELQEYMSMYIDKVGAARDIVEGIKDFNPETIKQISAEIRKLGLDDVFCYRSMMKISAALSVGGSRYKGKVRSLEDREWLFTEREKILNSFPVIPGNKLKRSGTRPNEVGCFEMDFRLGKVFYYCDSASVKDPSIITDDTYVVTRRYRIIGAGFETYEAAYRFAESIYKGQQPVAGKEKVVRRQNIPYSVLQNVKMTGDDYRRGWNVSGEDIMELFHLRGGEYGNWMSEEDRRLSLNCCYDSFMNIAVALGVEPSDVSLGNTLSIAFGARGHGSALAHYEPLREVINLTKMRGAGSLGHEWIHALDDIMGKKLQLSGMVSEACNNYMERRYIPSSFQNLLHSLKSKMLSQSEAIKYQQEKIDEFKSKTVEDILWIKKKMVDYPEDSTELEDAAYDFVSCPSENSYLKMLDIGEKYGAKRYFSSNRTAILSRGENIKWMINQLESYKKEDPHIEVDTQFFKNAKFIEETYTRSGHAYWTQDCELLARAGAAWLKDKLAAKGITDPYLCGHADMFVPGTDGDIYISPQGEERKKINKCFDNVVQELKEKGYLTDATYIKDSDENYLDKVDSYFDEYDGPKEAFQLDLFGNMTRVNEIKKK